MLGDHPRAILQFSGGKDSTALLYLARPYLDRITVIFGDTGSVFPHIVRFVHETCDKLGAELKIIRSPMPVAHYTAEHGLPADIVPVESDAAWAPLLHTMPKTPLQPYTRCCGEMLWLPMQRAIAESGCTLVLRGSKKADRRVGAPDGYRDRGIEYRSPLWTWTDEDVHAYLRQEGVELPAHYPAINDSLDCWLCTAHLVEHGAAKMKFIREHYPALWPEARRRMQAVYGTLQRDWNAVADAFSEAHR